MESMVLDQTVDYVLIMSDGKYKNKANNREGGVGTESTIISSEIYKDVSATKFIPVAMEIENGDLTLPQFCKSRRAINMTNEDNDYEGIEEIARWINDQPVYTRPKLGTVPDYNSKSTSIKKYEQKVFLSKTYNLEDNLHDYYKVLETELLELEDEQDEVSDQEILKIKPYIESFRKVFS
ncbi:TPA: SEFIR domain-containing protein, partial [Staphylococcus aureus]